jgi:hypothetical protein
MIMKNLFERLQKSVLPVLAVIALNTQAFAQYPDHHAELFMKVGKERKLILNIPRIADRAEIRLKGADGTIIYQETVKQGRYSRTFNLAAMTPGAYTASIALNGKEVTQPFTVLEHAIELDPAHRSMVQLPQIKLEGDAIELRVANSQIANVRVAIVSQEGELVFEDVVPATIALQRRYNLTRLPQGAYTFAVHTPERSLYQQFNR